MSLPVLYNRAWLWQQQTVSIIVPIHNEFCTTQRTTVTLESLYILSVLMKVNLGYTVRNITYNHSSNGQAVCSAIDCNSKCQYDVKETVVWAFMLCSPCPRPHTPGSQHTSSATLAVRPELNTCSCGPWCNDTLSQPQLLRFVYRHIWPHVNINEIFKTWPTFVESQRMLGGCQPLMLPLSCSNWAGSNSTQLRRAH